MSQPCTITRPQFFSSIEIPNNASTVWRLAEQYLDFGGTRFTIVKLDERTMLVQETSTTKRPLLSTALKVAVLFTILVPLVAIIAREIYRHLYDVRISNMAHPLANEEGSATSNITPDEQPTSDHENVGYFWKIKKNDKTIGYLLGSIHLVPEGRLCLNEHMRRCFDKSSCLAVETDFLDPKPRELTPVEELRWTHAIDALSPKQVNRTFAVLQKLWQQFLPNDPRTIKCSTRKEKCDFFRHAFSNYGKINASMFKKNLGPDGRLLLQAKAVGKTIEPLETDEQYDQLKRKYGNDSYIEDPTDISEALSEFCAHIQDSDPVQAVNDLVADSKQNADYLIQKHSAMFTAWEQGDLSHPPHTDHQQEIVERNYNMASKIAQLSEEEERIFCCVGALHLGLDPEQNIQTFLANEGFTTQRVLISE